MEYIHYLGELSYNPFLIIAMIILALVVLSIVFTLIRLALLKPFGGEIREISYFGFKYSKTVDGELKYVGHKPSILFSAEFGMDMKKLEGLENKKIVSRERAFMLTTAFLNLLIGAGVLALCLWGTFSSRFYTLASMSFLFGLCYFVIAIIRTIVKIPFTHTLCVGELQDLIISLAICCVSGFIYMKKKSKKTAVIALIFSSIIWTLIAVLSNAFVSIPIYIRFMFNGNEEILANIIGQVIPNVTVENYLIKYLLLSCLPFNVLLSTLVSVITFLVYKKSSILFKRFIDKGDEEDETKVGEC